MVPALIAAGVRPGKPQIRRAVAWLEWYQNDDGGWGEDLRSYDDPGAWSGKGASTASQTAWALLALLAAGERDSAAVERGVRWLAQTQRPDGTWDEPLVHRDRLPARLLPELPPVPAGVSRLRARPIIVRGNQS